MEKSELLELKKTACNVRLWTIEGVFNAKSGHPGGSLSAADIMTYLYFKETAVLRFMLHWRSEVISRQRRSRCCATSELCSRDIRI